MAAYSEVPAHEKAWSTKPIGAWTTGLCGCFEDLNTCCCTCFFDTVMVGQNAEIISNGAVGCGTVGLITYALESFLCACCLYSCKFRTQLRQKYSLPEEPCNDLVTHCLCYPCAVCQETRELKNRGWDPSISHEANVAIFMQKAKLESPTPQEMYK